MSQQIINAGKDLTENRWIELPLLNEEETLNTPETLYSEDNFK